MQDRFDKFEWMLDKSSPLPANESDDYSPPYGDVTALNRCRLIMDSVGMETLREIGRNAINLLETSVAIYEANGDYAFGMFSSGWCRLMDAASRELCNTDDNRTALSCGKWLCHENCWHDSAKRAIETGKSTDIACVGGIHLYAEPIYAGQRVVGAINIGYGDPPKSLDKLNALADRFNVDPETLKEIGDSYKSRPEFLVEATKKLLASFAKLIGEIVEKAEIQRKQQKNQLRELYLNNVLKAIRNVDQLIIKENDPSRLIQKACEELTDTMGYYNAWIVLLDEHSRNMTLTGSAGFNGGFNAFQDILNQGFLPSCVQRALEKKELIVINDPKNTCTNCPLSRHYHGRSALTHQLGNFGILSVSVPAHFAHDREEQALFVEVANDLAFALSKIEAEKQIHIKKHIIQTIPHPISLVSDNYRYLAVNEAYSRFHNETPNKITGRRITDFIDPDVFEQEIKPHLDRCLKGETVQYETLVDFYGTGNRWMRMEYTPFRNKENHIVGVVSHGLDITERRQAEEALQKSEERFSLAMEASNDGIWDWDLTTGHIYCSPGVTSMLGYDTTDVIENVEQWQDLIHPADRQKAYQVNLDCVNNLTDSFVVEYRMKTKDGGLKWILGRGRAVYRDVSGKALRMAGTHQDITERKHYEKKLKEKEKRYRSLFSSSHEGICLHELIYEQSTPVDYRILDVNPKYEELTGIRRDQAIGALGSQLYQSDPVPYLEIYAEVVATQSATSFETYFHPLEKHFFISVFSPSKNKFATVFQDKTNQKKMEEQLRHAHKMEAIGTLAGGIAHEFNNMLGIIIGNTELALDDIPESNPATDYIQEVKVASLRAKDVVQKLLSVARKTPESRKPIRIGTVIKDALNLMRRTIPATIDIRTDITCSDEMILGDLTEITQVVINLCTNSVHAMAEESGILQVGLDTLQVNRASAFYDEDLKPGDYVRLTVTDTGKGIEAAYMDRIYDPYFTTKDVDQGLGMGLAVVHGIVKKHDGAIKIQSVVGRGTTVDVLFPLIEAQTETGTEQIKTLQKGKERILVVDDEPSIVRLITQMLTRSGYEVVGETSSASALNVFKDTPEQFDLVISDMSMPEISGDQLAQAIKQIRPGIPIIICTGHSNRMDENRANQLGIDAFITKPFSRKNITEVIPKVLHKINSEGQS
ncbi:hybrid sensor histidine kinase/response regulator [Desulfobacter latus]|uniref:histidine kinase n=1 Tax=Desulfobacter latus TaxID=2292 RepID=A0A850TAE9_9BACT|nr:PAS domain S-box protein [Desulfobacter latus]NWH05558.1 PAS domain S-box protein [Desulfobacter latus]